MRAQLPPPSVRRSARLTRCAAAAAPPTSVLIAGDMVLAVDAVGLVGRAGVDLVATALAGQRSSADRVLLTVARPAQGDRTGARRGPPVPLSERLHT